MRPPAAVVALLHGTRQSRGRTQRSDHENGRRTWGGEWWKVGGGGGTVWDGMTYDPELNRVYIGVGNSGPYDPRVRSPGNGDNLFLASIVALDADSGRYIWHYQVNPREAWDYKACTNMITATLKIAGAARRVLMQSPTNGFFLCARPGKTAGSSVPRRPEKSPGPTTSTWRPVVRLKAPISATRKGRLICGRALTARIIGRPCPTIRKPGSSTSPTCSWGARYSAGGTTSEVGAAPSKGNASPLGGVDISPLIIDPEDGKGALLAWDPEMQTAALEDPARLDVEWRGLIDRRRTHFSRHR